MQNKILASALALAISSAVYAQTATTLDTINVNIGQEGAKNKTNVVTKETLNKRTDNDLRGALRAEPSINFGGGNGTSQWVTIRGVGQNYIDYKVDDVYTDSQIFHHQGRFMTDPALVKIVSVQKGTGSASAGIGATSGSIVAETVSAADLLQEGKSFGGRVQAGVSSNKGHQYGVSVFGRAGGLDALVVANFNKRSNYDAGRGYVNAFGTREVFRSGVDQRGLLGKVSYDFNPDNKVTLSFRQERDTGWRSLREEFDATATSRYAVVGNNGLTATEIAQGYTIEAGTRYKIDPQGNYVDVNSSVYRIATQNTTNLAYDGQNLGFVSRVKANVYSMEMKRNEPAAGSLSKLTAKGFNINLESALGEHHLLKYGVNFRDEDSSSNLSVSSLSTHKQTKKDTGLYAEGIWGLGQFTLTTGVRYDHFNYRALDGSKVSHGHVNPSLGLIYDVNDRLSFNISHNYATRSPRLQEAMLAGMRTTHVNSDLKAERAQNTEIGFDYNVTDNFNIEGSYFWNNIRDAIGSTNANGLISYHNNAGRLKNTGYELGANYRVDNGLRFHAGVAYSKPKRMSTGYAVDSRADAIPTGRSWTAGVGYNFENLKLEVGYRGRFVQHSHYQSGPTNYTKRAGYGVNDLYANWEPMKDLNINFSVNNLFNKYYKSHTQTTGTASLAESGRDVRLNFNYSF